MKKFLSYNFFKKYILFGYSFPPTPKSIPSPTLSISTQTRCAIHCRPPRNGADHPRLHLHQTSCRPCCRCTKTFRYLHWSLCWRSNHRLRPYGREWPPCLCLSYSLSFLLLLNLLSLHPSPSLTAQWCIGWSVGRAKLRKNSWKNWLRISKQLRIKTHFLSLSLSVCPAFSPTLTLSHTLHLSLSLHPFADH